MSRRNLTPALVMSIVCALLVCTGSTASAEGAITHHRAGVGVADSATLVDCIGGATPADRSAKFGAAMQAIARSKTMAVSFDLYEKTLPGGAFAYVAAPGTGVWETSNPGIASFTADQNVTDLPAPDAFRAVVHYRWFNARHRVIRTDVLVTPPCVTKLVPVPEPDLFVVSIAHSPGTPASTTENYTVVVRNSGPGPAPSFVVALSVGSTALPQQTVPGLAAATSTTVAFTGPRCTAGATLTATVDPSGAITEPSAARRTVSITCPTPGSGRSGSTGSTGSTG